MTKEELLQFVQTGKIRVDAVKYDSSQQRASVCMGYATLELNQAAQGAVQQYGAELIILAMFNDTRVCSYPEEHRSSWHAVKEDDPSFPSYACEACAALRKAHTCGPVHDRSVIFCTGKEMLN